MEVSKSLCFLSVSRHALMLLVVFADSVRHGRFSTRHKIKRGAASRFLQLEETRRPTVNWFTLHSSGPLVVLTACQWLCVILSEAEHSCPFPDTLKHRSARTTNSTTL